MQVIVDKLLTNYLVLGRGKTILLLHGWGDNSKGMDNLAHSLANNYRVVTLDLPGFGGTQVPKEAWNLNSYAVFLAKFLTKIHSDPLFAIVAHSNGGAIAIRALGSGKLSAEKCVLLGSSGVRGVYKGRTKLIRIITKAGKTLASPLSKSVKTKLRRSVYKTIGSDMLVAEHLQETFKKIVTDDVRDDAAKIDIPTLLIYGENDDQAPVSYGRQFHELMTNSSLEIVGSAGHFVHIDQAVKVYKLIEDFLK